MATGTLGTNANTSLTSITFGQGVSDADFATIALGIKNDLVNGNPIFAGAFSRAGLLYYPNRGLLKVLPGDVVAIDHLGWPVLVSAASIAEGSSSWHLV